MLLFLNLNLSAKYSDSLFIQQNQILRSICKEIALIGDEVAKIDSSKFRSQVKNFSTELSDSLINKITYNIAESNQKEEKSLGDFLYNSAADLFGAFLGASIALLLFYWQTKKDLKAEELKKQELINNKISYLKSVMNSVINLSEKLRNSGVKFTKEIKNNPYEIPELQLYPLQDFRRLDRIISDESYFYAFMNYYGNSQGSIERYKDLSSLSDYLKSQTDQLFQNQLTDRESDHKRKMNYKIGFETVSNAASELGITNEKSNPDLHRDIEKVLKNYQSKLNEENQTDLSLHQNEFITPLRDVLLEYMFDIEEVRKVLDNIKSISQIYREIPLQNINVAEDYSGFLVILESVVNKLKIKFEEIKSSD